MQGYLQAVSAPFNEALTTRALSSTLCRDTYHPRLTEPHLSNKRQGLRFCKGTSALSIGIGLPPVPQKLVMRIQAGEYIDMAELLPDRLGISTGLANRDDKQATRSKAPSSNEHSRMDPMLWHLCCSPHPEASRPHTGSPGLSSTDSGSLYGIQP